MFVALCVVTFTLVRKHLGWALLLIATFALLYAWFGYLIPGKHGHGGYDLARLTSILFLSTEGIFLIVHGSLLMVWPSPGDATDPVTLAALGLGIVLLGTPFLRELQVPIVIDHMGRIDASACPDNLAFQLLIDLMKDERFWVKACDPERVSRSGLPFHDAAGYGRLLWGIDWPHPNSKVHRPDDGELVELIEIIPRRRRA